MGRNSLNQTMKMSISFHQNRLKKVSVVRLELFPPVCNISETQLKCNPPKKFSRKLALGSVAFYVNWSDWKLSSLIVFSVAGWAFLELVRTATSSCHPRKRAGWTRTVNAFGVSCFRLGFRNMNDLVEVCHAFSWRLSITTYYQHPKYPSCYSICQKVQLIPRRIVFSLNP